MKEQKIDGHHDGSVLLNIQEQSSNLYMLAEEEKDIAQSNSETEGISRSNLISIRR